MQMIAKLALAVLTFSVIVSCTGLAFVETKPVSYILKTDLTKDQIYDKFLSYASHVYNSPKTVIHMQNREGGEVVVHASTKVDAFANIYVDYIFSAKIKDGAIKLTFEIKDREQQQRYIASCEETFLALKNGFEKKLTENDDF